MKRILNVASLAAIAALGLAWSDGVAETVRSSTAAAKPCEATGAPDNCVPLVFCVEPLDDERPIMGAGRAYGWKRGVVVAKLSSGVACGGEWRLDDATGGELFANCEGDGRLAIQIDPASGATAEATVYGVYMQGAEMRRVVGWSGADVAKRGEHVAPASSRSFCAGEMF